MKKQIKYLTNHLNELKHRYKENYDNIKEDRERWSVGSSMEDTFTHVLYLESGYEFNRYHGIFDTMGFVRNNVGYIDKYGHNIGFICEKEHLFEASSRLHRDIWRERVSYDYEGSLNEFRQEMKDNCDLLISRLGDHNDVEYIVEFSDKKLGIGEHVIVLYNKDQFYQYEI